ncbi:MAG: hypothetical protein K5695_17845 [Oscillospiraceae bacterium]|nr:hypothetical protein [Oscillospiraceae bacterium]
MNMSDDVVSVTLSVTQTAAQTGGHAVDKTIDMIAKLLDTLMNDSKQRAAERAAKKAAKQEAKATKPQDIKPGTVSMKELVRNARQTGDTLSTAEQGMTKADRQFIAKKAKEYGIPVAFTGSKGKDNYYASVRTSDLPVFRQICTEMMQTKMAERPKALDNFKVNEWEVPFLTAEMKQLGVTASFGKTKGGESFCLYEKRDEKAIMAARDAFVRKCSEIEKDMQFSRDDDGFFHIQDSRTGQELTFDELPARQILSAQMQERFGMDENKANIACAKFGQELLQGQEKQCFFTDNPQDAFSRVDANITVEGEAVAAKAYDCWRLTPKTDDVPRIVFRDQEGNFSVLQPEKMTQLQMAKQLRTDLRITDNTEIMALVDKAKKVSDYYVTQQNTELSYDFKKSDFDMKNPDVVSGMLRTDEDGNTFAKSLPISSIDNQIERTGKDSFTVTITGTAIETDQNGVEYPITQTQTLELSFSDKKKALHDITDCYKQQGVSDHIAGAMAKDVFRMASEQSAEKVLLVEEVKSNAVRISHADQTVEVPTADPAEAVKAITEVFDVSEQQAEIVLAQADDLVYPLTAEDLNSFAFFSEDAPALDDAPLPFDEEVPENWEDVPEPYAEDLPFMEEPPEYLDSEPAQHAEDTPHPVTENITPVVEEAPQPVTEEAPKPVVEVVPEPVKPVEPVPTSKPVAATAPEPIKPIEPAPAPKPLSVGMQFLTGEKKLDGVTFLNIKRSNIDTDEILLHKVTSAPRAQFVMMDNQIYLNPLYKGIGAQQGLGKLLSEDVFKAGVDQLFDRPKLSSNGKYAVEDLRPATVRPEGGGFVIVEKGSVDLREHSTGNILKAPEVGKTVPKLPEVPKLPDFPKSELPLFRR